MSGSPSQEQQVLAAKVFARAPSGMKFRPALSGVRYQLEPLAWRDVSDDLVGSHRLTRHHAVGEHERDQRRRATYTAHFCETSSELALPAIERRIETEPVQAAACSKLALLEVPYGEVEPAQSQGVLSIVVVHSWIRR